MHNLAETLQAFISVNAASTLTFHSKITLLDI